MVTIKKISSTGFQSIENNTGYQCDKFKVLSKEPFLSLKVSDHIDNIKKNPKGYVISFDLVSLPIVEGVNLLGQNSTVQPPKVKSPVREDSIYGQCVTLAFNNIQDDLRFKDTIPETFDLADRIYDEYIKRLK